MRYMFVIGSEDPSLRLCCVKTCSAKRNVISLGLPTSAVYSSSFPVSFYKNMKINIAYIRLLDHYCIYK